MVMIPPRHYCVIANPVVLDEDKQPIFDIVDAEHGVKNIRLRHGDEEIRGERDPFPLYPGERLIGKVTPLQVVAANAALRLRAIRDFKEGNKDFSAGDEWLFAGPATYFPSVNVSVVEIVRATIIKQNEAIKLRARRKMNDISGVERQAGEEWLYNNPGSYLPGVDEEITDSIKAIILTDKKAIHLRARKTFKDVSGKERKAGQEWLITIKEAETHIPDVYEEFVGEVKITTLTNRQYCVILDPVGADGKNKYGRKLLFKGEASFFLAPGERLENGIQPVHVLAAEEALLLRAREKYVEEDGVEHKPGDKWMIFGPTDYIPPTEVEIIEKRKSIPLDDNEGIYVRDMSTGAVRAIIGSSYMVKAHEELWEKELPQSIEELLTVGPREYAARVEKRDKTRVVSYRAPHNSAVQVYDFAKNITRIIFGPDLVMLGPDEHFTLLSISGGKPKRENAIRSLSLLLGPDFMTDIVTVETSDHARLSLQLAYNWRFGVDPKSEDSAKIFAVPDFVGEACKTIASRVRGAVASTSFDDFHKSSAEVIRNAVFGKQEKLVFANNSLNITGIDIQAVEPIDQKTRESLQKSVQLAIEITTKSQEAYARHEAQRKEQVARGQLERQKITDEAQAERARTDLLALQAQSAAVESTGHATAEAKARAEAAQIEGLAAVNQARQKAEALQIKASAELKQLTSRQHAEVEHQKSVNELELHKAAQLAEIESTKFKEVVEAIGADTIKSIAQAGPEMQAKLLQGLGIKGMMITDGHSPINLFNCAKGLIGGLD